MAERNEKIIRKYLTKDYKRRDTPSFIRYEHTGTKEDLLKLLKEYEHDCEFLSCSLIDDILDKVEEIVIPLVEYDNKNASDMELIENVWYTYDVAFKERQDKFNELAREQHEHDAFYGLIDPLNIRCFGMKDYEEEDWDEEDWDYEA